MVEHLHNIRQTLGLIPSTHSLIYTHTVFATLSKIINQASLRQRSANDSHKLGLPSYLFLHGLKLRMATIFFMIDFFEKKIMTCKSIAKFGHMQM